MIAFNPFLTSPVRKWLNTDYRTYPDRMRIEALEAVIREWADATELRDQQVRRNEARLIRNEERIARLEALINVDLDDDDAAGESAALCAEAVAVVRQWRSAVAALRGEVVDDSRGGP